VFLCVCVFVCVCVCICERFLVCEEISFVVLLVLSDSAIFALMSRVNKVIIGTHAGKSLWLCNGVPLVCVCVCLRRRLCARVRV